MSRVLVTGRVPEAAIAKLRAEHEVDAWPGPESIGREDLLRRAAGADAIVSLLTDSELLDAAGPQLKVVANVAVGYDNIDCPRAPSGASWPPTHRACSRRPRRTSRSASSSRRPAGPARGNGSSAPARTGSGACSSCSAAACKARPSASSVWAALARRPHAGPRPSAWKSFTSHAKCHGSRDRSRARRPRADLDELLANSDIVSLHCPYAPATHHLIGSGQLAAVKGSAYLINTARGPIVDEAALASALREGRIAGAGLDVYEQEPRVHPALLELDNVVLLPHLGSATVETRTAMAMLAANNALAVLGGVRPPHLSVRGGSAQQT